ncbi:MAG: CrcB family protein [Ornithinibacter sp.]
MTLTHALLVALGGSLGAPLRYAVNHVLRQRLATTPPFGTLAVNVSGSLVLGLLVGVGVTGSPLLLVGVGFCGAFTTFSTLALELWDAIEDDRRVEATAIVTLSLTLGLGAAYLGFLLTS